MQLKWKVYLNKINDRMATWPAVWSALFSYFYCQYKIFYWIELFLNWPANLLQLSYHRMSKCLLFNRLYSWLWIFLLFVLLKMSNGRWIFCDKCLCRSKSNQSVCCISLGSQSAPPFWVSQKTTLLKSELLNLAIL